MATAKKKNPKPTEEENTPVNTTDEGTTENGVTDAVSGNEVTTTDEVIDNADDTTANTDGETLNEAESTVDEASAPITPNNPLGSEVTVVDRDGEYLGEVMTSEEADALQAAEVPKPRKQCQGLFMMIDGDDFTQNEKYSDTYLKSKGLFKGE